MQRGCGEDLTASDGRGRPIAVGIPGGGEAVEGGRPWNQAPSWLYLPNLQDERREREGDRRGSRGTEEGMGSIAAAQVQKEGHWLTFTGNLVWCSRCACFAHKRFGAGLKDACKLVRTGVVRARFARMHGGRHCTTGEMIREEGQE